MKPMDLIERVEQNEYCLKVLIPVTVTCQASYQEEQEARDELLRLAKIGAEMEQEIAKAKGNGSFGVIGDIRRKQLLERIAQAAETVICSDLNPEDAGPKCDSRCPHRSNDLCLAVTALRQLKDGETV
jgi:hypothetical protein